MEVFSIRAITDSKVNEAVYRIHRVTKENSRGENGRDIHINPQMKEQEILKGAEKWLSET